MRAAQEEYAQKVRLAAPAVGAVIGLLVVPALALASGEPRFYHGTLEIDQRPLKTSFPEGSSVAYAFHARYTIAGRLASKEPHDTLRYYSLAGPGNQHFAYAANLHMTTDIGTRDFGADWHGDGRWTKHGQVVVLQMLGRHFLADVDLGFGAKTIPLSVTSDEMDVSTSDRQTCVFRAGMHGATAFSDDSCAPPPKSTTVPHGMAVNPYTLLDERDGRYRICPGVKRTVRLFNGLCGKTKRSGRIHITRTNVFAHSLDFPFHPWRDDDAAFDPNYGYPFGELGWGAFEIATKLTLNLKPGR